MPLFSQWCNLPALFLRGPFVSPSNGVAGDESRLSKQRTGVPIESLACFLADFTPIHKLFQEVGIFLRLCVTGLFCPVIRDHPRCIDADAVHQSEGSDRHIHDTHPCPVYVFNGCDIVGREGLRRSEKSREHGIKNIAAALFSQENVDQFHPFRKTLNDMDRLFISSGVGHDIHNGARAKIVEVEGEKFFRSPRDFGEHGGQQGGCIRGEDGAWWTEAVKEGKNLSFQDGIFGDRFTDKIDVRSRFFGNRRGLYPADRYFRRLLGYPFQANIASGYLLNS